MTTKEADRTARATVLLAGQTHLVASLEVTLAARRRVEMPKGISTAKVGTTALPTSTDTRVTGLFLLRVCISTGSGSAESWFRLTQRGLELFSMGKRVHVVG